MVDADEYEVVIIGAGFSGIAIARGLLKRGVHSFLILESADAIGGTWQVNNYPGCACDVPSVLYSLSWRPQSEFTRVYSSQSQILLYLRTVADEIGIANYIQYNSRVTRIVWTEPTMRWRIECSNGRTINAHFVVSAVGALSRPHVPALPGAETFSGRTFHSQQWDHSYSLDGKRVGVVGTGASAIQFIPHVARRAAHLTVFQRTPPWILPRRDRLIPAVVRSAFRKLPFLLWIMRLMTFLINELTLLGFLFSAMWLPSWIALRHLNSQVADPVLREKLRPHYSMGCKRILLSDDYYPALTQPNVDVVNTAISSVTAHGIRTDDGVEHELDCIIYGTGFHVTDGVDLFTVVGPNGVDLGEKWTQNGMTAYLGTTVAGFPNLMFLAGPNTGIGHTSLLVMIESQCAYIEQAIHLSVSNNWQSLSVKQAISDEYNAAVQRRTKGTVWSSGCRSWYLDDRGINRALWPDFTSKFTWQTRRFDVENYDVKT